MATRIAPLLAPAYGLAAKVALIDDADSTLDVQYYQWDEDDVGFLLLDRLLSAADRGVDVRLLVDDLRLWRRTRRQSARNVVQRAANWFFGLLPIKPYI